VVSRRAKRPIRFKRLRKTVCPACLDRNALNIVGRPVFIRGSKLTGGCELCNGSGQVTEGFLVDGWPKDDAWVVREKG